MSDPQRREFLAAAGIASLAALAGAQPAAGGDPSFMNNVPDPVLAGKELPTFKFALEKSDGKVIGNSYGKEATVEQLPISKGIAGVSMRLEPGAMRELHWHATAAEWAFVIEGRVRTTVDRSRRPRRDQRLRARRRLVLSARPRPHARVPGRQAVPLHPDLRQRLLLRVRHLQHHRLDRAHAARRCWRRISACRSRRSTSFPKEEVYFARGTLPPAEPSAPLQGWKLPPQTHKYRLLAQPPHRDLSRAAASGASTPAGSRSRRRSPASSSTSIPARCGAALAPHRRRVAVRHRRQRQRHAVRLARPLPDRDACRRATSATSRRATATRSRTSATKPCRILIGFNTGVYETIDLSQWIAGKPERRARDQLQPAGGAVRKIPAIATCSSPARMGPANRPAI